MRWRVAAMILGGLTLLVAPSAVAEPLPLALEAKIALGGVRGRIDHLSIDLDRRLLFVAELGNNSVGVVDLRAGQVLRRLTGLHEPQGVAWHAGSRTLYVANAGDGTVRLFAGPGFDPAGQIALGEDADSVRIDSRRGTLVVGHGSGALALIDPGSRRKVGELPLKGHPESFQFDETASRIFANVPQAREVAVLDVDARRQVAALDLAGARSNFPMALDVSAHRLLVVAREPARLLVFATADGLATATVETCGDADDLFVDPLRKRLYVICGEGVIDVFDRTPEGYVRAGRVPTARGARTGLFVPETDRLYVAVRAGSGEAAAIWVFRPGP